jgi:hypothetical protein
MHVYILTSSNWDIDIINNSYSFFVVKNSDLLYRIYIIVYPNLLISRRGIVEFLLIKLNVSCSNNTTISRNLDLLDIIGFVAY